MDLNVFKCFADWWNIYLDIVAKLGIDTMWDRIATLIAYSIAKSFEPPLDLIRSTIMGRRVVVFGAGPNLEKHLRIVKNSTLWGKSVFIAADGATKALVKQGLIPHIIVTDLDGDITYIKIAVDQGSIPVVHVHGDNVDIAKNFLNYLVRHGKKFVVSTQVEPMYPVINFGGFTDGDRAVAIALVFRAREILLAGMDFGDVVGEYSKPWLTRPQPASPKKKTKLEIAYKIVSLLSCNTKTPIYTLSDSIPQCVIKLGLTDEFP